MGTKKVKYLNLGCLKGAKILIQSKMSCQKRVGGNSHILKELIEKNCNFGWNIYPCANKVQVNRKRMVKSGIAPFVCRIRPKQRSKRPINFCLLEWRPRQGQKGPNWHYCIENDHYQSISDLKIKKRTHEVSENEYHIPSSKKSVPSICVRQHT